MFQWIFFVLTCLSLTLKPNVKFFFFFFKILYILTFFRARNKQANTLDYFVSISYKYSSEVWDFFL